MKNITILFIVLFSCSNIYAQKKIKLTRSARTRIIKEGMRICYKSKGSVMIKKGYLQTVNESFIVVDGQQIVIEDLNAIGRKRRGSGIVQFIYGYFAGAFFVDAISPTDNTPSCNGCQTTTTVDEGAVAGEILLGSGFIALGVNSIVRNSPRNLSKWKLEIID